MIAGVAATGMIPLVALVGPTATGKTALALALTERLRAVIPCAAVAADSRQLYRLMDIATAKPTPAERATLPHALIDMVWPDESYTLAQYQADAQAAIAATARASALPLLIGGTGLYVRSVVDGLAIPSVAPQPTLRAELEAEAATHGTATLHTRLAALDPTAAARIDPTNCGGSFARWRSVWLPVALSRSSGARVPRPIAHCCWASTWIAPHSMRAPMRG